MKQNQCQDLSKFFLEFLNVTLVFILSFYSFLLMDDSHNCNLFCVNRFVHTWH